MIIKVRTEPKGVHKIIDIEAGSTIRDLIAMLEDEIKYSVVYAKMNNALVEITTPIKENSEVEILDIRTQAANLIYQNSLALIYLRAIDEVLPGAKVVIDNPLNKGLYTEIKLDHKITQAEINKIDKEMRKLIALDLPFNKETLTRETALEYFQNQGLDSRLKMLESNPDVEKVDIFSLDGYKDFFCGQMALSTGYIKHFELKKYKGGVLLRFPHPGLPDEIPEYVDEVKLYEAFEQQKEWDGLLGVEYVEDLNEKIDAGELLDLVQLSEALHEKRVAQVADLITKHNKRIVLIAGPSSSGKTTFARRLCIQLRVNGLRPIYLGTDDYFVNRSDTPLDANGEKDYENLNALDLKLFNKNMKDLIAGKEVDMPTYDFIKGEKIFGQKITKLDDDQLLVIEGIHALNEKLTEMIPHEQKYKIYISPLTQLGIDEHNRISTTDERMLRRLVRDYQFRGYSAKETIKNWPKVRAGEDNNIFPYSGEADILFNSYHVYEIAVLKKYAEPLLREITREDEEYADASRMLQFLQFFHAAPDDSMIVNNSIIREFIGGSIFL
ncbi:MAG: TGS domain-containing protein [Firmicutes bacterium]|nr:TGS domain-containing protein [Bacillota bacterium]